MYIVNTDMDEIYYSTPRLKNSGQELKWNISKNSTVAVYVATKKECVLCSDVSGDRRFPEGLGYEGIKNKTNF